MAKRTDWVTASEIATYMYCQESWRLTHGLKIPPGNIPALKHGTAKHAAWQKVERFTSGMIRAAWVLARVTLALLLVRFFLL
jgi:hypothetical protein